MRTDEELVRAVRAGDLGAFDALYQRYEGRLFGYVLRLCRDRALAEDLFQEIFLTVLQDAPRELAEGRFRPWLFAVARNRTFGHLRQSGRQDMLLAHAAAEPEPPAALSARAPLSIDAPAAERAIVRDALSRLPALQQEVLLLKEVGELSYREIAEVQSIPEGTAKSRVHFAIAALRRVFSS